MIPPSTRDIIKVADSKYAVVVAVSKRARAITEEGNEEYRLSSIVNETLQELLEGNLTIKYTEPEA